MQFRERRRVIQVIRTTYDPELKRGRSELVGKLDKEAPEITEKLRNSCTPAELTEISDYLGGRRANQRNAAVHAGAATLPEQMRRAAEYFQTHRDDKALAFATEIRAAWDELKSAMRKAGFSKSKVRHAAKAAGKAAHKPATAPLAEPAALEAAPVEAAPVETGPGKAKAKRGTAKPAAAAVAVSPPADAEPSTATSETPTG